MRVLVIEDDEELANEVAAGLRYVRMAVDVAFDGHAGLSRALLNEYDVIVLDRDLPGLHGDQLCARLIAERRRSRVLMLTAAASRNDLVHGLGLGADDYSSCCSQAKDGACQPRNSSLEPGTRQPILSRTPSSSRSAACEQSSATHP